MLDSWIRMFRKFKKWQWFHNPEMVQLFICLLLDASPTRRNEKNTVIERGQLVTSYDALHADTGLSVRTLRTCLARLEETGEITRVKTNKYTVITICNYDTYQGGEDEVSEESFLKPEQPKKVPAKPAKPKKTKEDIVAATKKRMADFYNSLIPYVSVYGKEMVRAFYNYWSETNKSCSKMKFEQETTWVLERRLDYWANREKAFSTNGNGKNKSNSSAEQRNADAANNIAAFITGSDD